MENERLESIELLSDLRAKYNCFDEKEEPYYRALSLAIASIKELMCIKELDDCVSRQAVLDLVNSDWKYEGLEAPINCLPSVTPMHKVMSSTHGVK
jgi:hypothetical protein